jgi:hypothetical protein
MMNMYKFKPTRLLITSFYFASMISFYIFRLIPDLLFTWTTWFLSFFAQSLSVEVLNEGAVWWCLLLVCMSITFIVRKFVVEPLGFYVNGNATSASELLVLAFLILGFYLYSFNILFPEYMMPDSPEIIRVLLGDNIGNGNIIDANAWSIVPWIWYLGPVLFMYTMFLKSEFSYAKQARNLPES